MRNIIVILLLAVSPSFAAITNVRVTDSTNIEFVVRYVAPTPAACTIEVSESPTYSPLVNDVNPSLFTNANRDDRNGAQGRERIFVVGSAGTGARFATVALSGASTSRALQTNTNHYYRITCGPDTASGIARIANIAVGDTFPGTPEPIDPARLGDVAWPEVPWKGTAAVIDPTTGVKIARFRNMNERLQTIDPVAFQYAFDGAGGWTNKTNVLVDDAALATVSSSDPLRVYTTWVYPKSTLSMTGLTLAVHGFRDASGTTSEACLSIDGATCYGPWVAFALPVGSLGATVNVGDTLPTVNVSSDPAMFGSWLSAYQKLPTQYDTSIRSGTANNVGAVLTLYSGSFSGAFDPRWTTGTHLLYNSVDYTVASVTSGSELTLNTAPPSNYTNTGWSAANFGFMVRRSSGTGTLSIDSMQFIPTLNGTYNTNNGSGSVIPCTAAVYPSGYRIGLPGGQTNLNYNAATNTSPIKVTTTSLIPLGAIVAGDTVQVRDVPGNVAANGTWVVSLVTQISGGTEITLTGSDGTTSGSFPSDATGSFDVFYGGGGLIWKEGTTKGSLCTLLNGDGAGADKYWVNTAVDPPDIRYLGLFSFRGDDVAPYPEVPAATEMRTVSGKQEIFSCRYIGDTRFGMFQDIGSNQHIDANNSASRSSFGRCVSTTPAPNTFTDRVNAFDSETIGLPCALIATPKTTVTTFGCTAVAGEQQNGLGYAGIYNPVTKQVVGGMNTWKNANARWCGNHTFFSWPEADAVQWVPYELIGDNGSGNFGIGNGPYQLFPTSASLNSTSDIGDCATKIASEGQTNVLGVSGSSCSLITLTNAIPITPAGATPANDTRNNTGIRVGDTMSVRNTTGAPGNSGSENGERVRIVAINGLRIIVLRGQEQTSIVNQTANFKLNMFCNIYPRWWDYVNAPHGETGTDPYSQNLNGIFVDGPLKDASHLFSYKSLSVSDSGGVAAGYLSPEFTCSDDTTVSTAYYATRSYPWPNHIKAPTSAYGCVKGNPTFDGKAGNGFGQFLEKHPSSVQNYTTGPDASFTDARPMQAYWAMTTGPVKNTVITKVGTYVFKVTDYDNYGQAFDEKRHKLYVGLGSRTGYDVSASGFILPDTTPYNYTYCLTHVAGECRAGSAVGDVYVNVPNVAKQSLGYAAEASPGTYQCAGGSDPVFTDICVIMQSAYTNATVQYPVVHDPYNSGARILTHALSAPRATGGLWSAPNFPNGDYQINWTMVAGRANMISMMVKVPPYPGVQRGTNRNSWIPIPVKVSSVPAGASTVTVEFGYSPSFFCHSRQEACVAVGSTIGPTPYYYAADTYTRLSCSSGCTPVIPALSQRMMWYRLKYWSAASVLIKTGETQVLATP